ncbi:hypothetical protein ACIBK8_04675 [Streptomyces sp. NPDC050161]|uniref:hypothetical protein n=1 Tax=Streptomyces sp. NPDC050161 TaxID=3365604 RepID=UPI00378970D0
MPDPANDAVAQPVAESPLAVTEFVAYAYHLSNKQGVFTTLLSAQGVNRFSEVVGSIAELDAQDRPQLGDAVMTLHNVVPQDNNTVAVRGEVAWHTPLRVRVHIIARNVR